MIHQMKLFNRPFQIIKSESKTIEMRLNDEKRRLIKINDIIEFINNDTSEVMKAMVINLYYYDTFEQLYNNHNKIAIGYTIDEEAKPEDMLAYYSQDKINKYGVVGIEIKVIK